MSTPTNQPQTKKSNSLLVYVLYGLLGLFILAAGYYAWQKQKEKKEQATRDAAELEETLRDMGYETEDTIAPQAPDTLTLTQKPAPDTIKVATGFSQAEVDTMIARAIEKAVAAQKSTTAKGGATDPEPNAAPLPDANPGEKTTAKGVAKVDPWSKRLIPIKGDTLYVTEGGATHVLASVYKKHKQAVDAAAEEAGASVQVHPR